MEFKTIIFDLDGTLLNTLQDLADAGNSLCEDFGWPTHTLDAFRLFIGDGIAKLVERILPPGQYSAEFLAERISVFEQRYQRHMCDKTEPYEGIIELLKRLTERKKQIAVLTNKTDFLAQKLIKEKFPLLSFDKICGKSSCYAPKPDPASLLALMDSLNADKSTTLYVGDSRCDVETAHRAGIKCCGVLWGFRGKEELEAAGADWLVVDANELECVILGI